MCDRCRRVVAQDGVSHLGHQRRLAVCCADAKDLLSQFSACTRREDDFQNVGFCNTFLESQFLLMLTLFSYSYSVVDIMRAIY